jgi:hypothetical protein
MLLKEANSFVGRGPGWLGIFDFPGCGKSDLVVILSPPFTENVLGEPRRAKNLS